MSEQLIDTHFPGQQFPVGSVVTFLDRHRRTVLGTVTELRRHEAIVAAGEAGRWRMGIGHTMSTGVPRSADTPIKC